ncbi:MAG: hypothetical protein JEZ00_19300 [Anaerolineaceae bacterium]|nr:hypothetical protein [Anaerolineaceae bacterium]
MPAAEMPAEEPKPTETEVPEITHVMKPKYGDGKAQTIHDQMSDKTAPEKRAYGGDEYANGRYERPFLAEDMEYLPFIDILRTDMYRDDDDVWAYVSIEVISAPSLAGDKDLSFGVEIDEDLDGRGDLFILAKNPVDSSWSTDGVQIWRDINGNIGDVEPMKPDAMGAGDGYEVNVFDEGLGNDADMAWVRLSSESDAVVEIAFKLDMIPKTKDAYIFLWGAWTFAGDPHLEWFDHHDTFALAEAGSPLKDNDNYPLKQFEAADNTCRGLSGMEPSGKLPGMCPYTPPQTTHSDPGDSCVPIDCCPSAMLGCSMMWDSALCQCVSIN